MSQRHKLWLCLSVLSCWVVLDAGSEHAWTGKDATGACSSWASFHSSTGASHFKFGNIPKENIEKMLDSIVI